MYTATITLTAKTGYTLDGVAINFFTVEGAVSTNPVSSGVITAVFPSTAADVVSISAIPGVTAPVKGATPVTIITETDQYKGTVTWSPEVDASFASNTVYTATITLTEKAGYTLDDVTKNFFTVEGADATNAVNSGVITAVYPSTAADVVSISAIPGVTVPSMGAKPVTTITETDQYTGTVTWNDNPAAFAAKTIYTATITLTAKTGYVLDGVAENFFTVSGAASVTNSVNSGIITAVFPETGAAPDTVINISAIPGVTIPVKGATPVTSITDTDQYTGTVAWSPEVSSTFAAGTVYTATITLVAKKDYTLGGIAENFFTVIGASSNTNPVNSGVVTVVFPATEKEIVNISAITGVTIPVKGETPVTIIAANDQYTGTVEWNDSPSTFVPNTVYTTTITLTPKTGYTLTGIAENFFTIAGAASVSNPANSGVVTAVFPATALETVTISAILGVTAPVTGVTPVTTITETDQYTGTIVWNPEVSSTFAEKTEYTAAISLTAKTGYTFDGLEENFFTVEGAASDSNPVNSGLVTAVYTTTETVVTSVWIGGLITPFKGEVPVTTFETAKCNGTIEWNPEVDSTFAADTVYTASINLTANAGYTLIGAHPNFLRITGATSVIYDANSGMATAVFRKTMFELTMKNVPAGSFQRDSTASNISVITEPYLMSECEITREQFSAVMGEDPSFSASSELSLPVECVNWYHAIAFCNILSIYEGLTPIYSVTDVDFTYLSYADIPLTNNEIWNAAEADWSANGYRLPTEMEWMWAAMGSDADRSNGYTGVGVNTTGYTKGYAGSTEAGGTWVNIDDYVWHFINCFGTQPVRTTGSTGRPNEIGLYDMSGNVYEWCWDWYADYPADNLIDYRGVTSGTKRTFRGGGWYGYSFDQYTITSRVEGEPSYQGNNMGFRVVRH